MARNVPPAASGRLGRAWLHVEPEHPLRVDTRVDRTRVEEFVRPLLAVARDVDVDERLPETGVRLAADVQLGHTPMNGHGQFLARQMGRADVGPLTDVAEAHRVGRRAEMKCAAVEDP